MDSILDYFISLQESEPAELPERAIERWNKRADFWEDARKKKEKGDERVISAINYLDSKGLLEKNYDVADIGCGPGRFAAAFAKYVHKVVGLDISDKMVKHGMEHIQNEGLNNAEHSYYGSSHIDTDKSEDDEFGIRVHDTHSGRTMGNEQAWQAVTSRHSGQIPAHCTQGEALANVAFLKYIASTAISK